MLILDNYKDKIEDFISMSIEKFKVENGEPSSVGIYCCPWAGWLTTNFNSSKTIEETHSNCPDFEFVAFDSLDLGEWQAEYENDLPMFEISGKIANYGHDLGDEKLNEIIFTFLEPIAMKIKKVNHQELLLQMLDSNCYKVI